MRLRKDQRRIVDAAVAAIRAGSTSVLMPAPTAFGKTVTMCAMVDELWSMLELDGFCLWVAHRDRLLVQAVDTMFAMAPHMLAKTVFLNSASPRMFPASLLVIDEAHHAPTATVERIREDAQPRIIIAATATAERYDHLGLRFETVLDAPDHDTLIAEQVLAPYEHFALDAPADPSHFVGIYLASSERWGRSIIFVNTVEAAHRAVAQLRAGGIAAAPALGDHSKESAVAAFTAGNLQVLVTVHALSEGVDLPAVRTVFIRDGHRGAVQQAVGRALRRHDGKVAQVVQFADARFPFLGVAVPRRRWLGTLNGTWVELPTEPTWPSETSDAKTRLASTVMPSPQDDDVAPNPPAPVESTP